MFRRRAAEEAQDPVGGDHMLSGSAGGSDDILMTV
jgi:hypothetical protein